METKENCFEGMLQSKGLNGGVSVTVAEDALLFTSLFDQLACFYSDIHAFAIEDYSLIIDTAFGRLRISQMGNALEWLFDKLWDKYNDAVQKALFVEGPPIYELRGEYCYEDAGGRSEGIATVRLFEHCVCIFPPNEDARRIPFCFVRGMKEEEFSLRLELDTGEAYTFRRLGGYKEGFTFQLTKCLQTLQKKSQKAAQEICGGLDSVQLTAIAQLMPEGVAASIGKLSAISPSAVEAIERQIANSRAAQAYAFFKSVCSPADICVGIKPAEKGKGERQGSQAQASVRESEDRPQESPYVIFFAASKAGPAGDVAAVELAIPEEESAATFFYQYQGGWDAFRRRLNRAMEAVSFRREVIWLGEEALNKPENAHYRMAVKRTEALRFLRACFIGRAIHSSPEAWRRDVEKRWEGVHRAM